MDTNLENKKTSWKTELEPNSTLEQTPIKEKKKKKISIKPKTIIIVVIVIAILVLAFIFKGLFIAAIVNGSPISRLSVIKELERVSGKSALESIISEKLISMEASKKGIIVSAEEVAAEIKKIEDQIKAQGGTLEEVLTTQGLTSKIFEKQVLLRKKLEKLLSDKIQVTDTEIEQYIKDNAIEIPTGQEENYKNQIKEQLQQQKLNTEATTLLDSLRTAAKIKYFIKY